MHALVTAYMISCTNTVGMLATQVELGHTEYGRFGSRLQKQITKAFFPRIHAALKPLAAEETSMGEQEGDHDGGCWVKSAVV